MRRPDIMLKCPSQIRSRTLVGDSNSYVRTYFHTCSTENRPFDGINGVIRRHYAEGPVLCNRGLL